MRRNGFVDSVRQFCGTGGDYYGGSAGAVLACESIAIADGHDANEAGLQDLTGLALISGVAILPHFTEEQFADARQWAIDNHPVVVGLPESAGLRCAEGRQQWSELVISAGSWRTQSPQSTLARASMSAR